MEQNGINKINQYGKTRLGKVFSFSEFGQK
jgi:hypothetical protein